MDDDNYTFADLSDEFSVRSLLAECNLPQEDIVVSDLSNFILAKSEKSVLGVIGLEIYRETGLIRSLCVQDSYRGKGIGKKLYERILAYAHSQGIKELYLLTTTAEAFFTKLGFHKINREAVPEVVKQTAEFESLCPVTALCMKKNIGHCLQYYPQEVLLLKPDVPGSRMWAVALQKTMFTYFEVEPNCVFEPHTHESEQITMVLEGTLYFKADYEVIPVHKGEVVAIPSNVKHAVFTKENSAKAVDAWSPVMDKYKN